MEIMSILLNIEEVGMDISKASCPDCGKPMHLSRAACTSCDVTLDGEAYHVETWQIDPSLLTEDPVYEVHIPDP